MNKCFCHFNGYEVKDAKARPFKTIDELKSRTNLVDGNIVKTIGYHTPNDGGGSTYLIRTRLETDIEDLGSIHFIGDSLVAELIIENNEVNVKQFGAKGDEITDDTVPFTNLLNSNIKNIYVPNGTYIVGALTFNGIKIRGEVDSYLKCKETTTNWITIKEKSNVSNLKFNGNKLADNVVITSENNSANGTIIEKCRFVFMLKNGLYSKGIDVTIKNCVFVANGQHGLRIDEVGNMVEGCYSYSNGGHGIMTIVGTCLINNCKVYCNKWFGYAIQGTNAHYVTINSCESQQNGSGSIFLSEESRDCIISNLNVLGDCDITVRGEISNQALLDISGKNHIITGSITPFHFFEQPEKENYWYAYPKALIKSNTAINCKVDINCNIIESEYELLKAKYPDLKYNTLLTANNVGQSNKFIVNSKEVRNSIFPIVNNNIHTIRGDIVGNKTDNFIFKAKPSFVNSLASGTFYTFGEYHLPLDDDFNINGYQKGIAYPLNYKDSFECAILIKFSGIVNGNEVIASSFDFASNFKNKPLNDYISYTIDVASKITNKEGYEAGSLKMITHIYVKKIKDTTITEPLLIGCNDISFIYDIDTNLK